MMTTAHWLLSLWIGTGQTLCSSSYPMSGTQIYTYPATAMTSTTSGTISCHEDVQRVDIKMPSLRLCRKLREANGELKAECSEPRVPAKSVKASKK